MAAENTDIDHIIDRLRAAHAAGTALDDIAARLHPIIRTENVGPLLELETSTPPTAEIMGEIPAPSHHGRNDARLNPLLGTICSSGSVRGIRKAADFSRFLRYICPVKSGLIPRRSEQFGCIKELRFSTFSRRYSLRPRGRARPHGDL